MTHEQLIADYTLDQLKGDHDWAGWAESGNADVALARLGELVLQRRLDEAQRYVRKQIDAAAEGHAQRMEDNA